MGRGRSKKPFRSGGRQPPNPSGLRFPPIPKKEPVKHSIGNTTILGDAPDIVDMLPESSYISAWGSPEAFIRHIESIPRDKLWEDAGWVKGQEDFYGTATMEQALHLAKEGWKEGAEKVDSLRALIEAQRPKAPRWVKYGVAGAFPNVPRAIAGDPLNMVRDDLAKRRKKTPMTILVHIGALCYVKPESLTNRAAVLAAILDEIESEGYACEILACTRSSGFGKDYIYTSAVRVKDSSQPVDIKRLAYAMGHASYFRRMVFVDKGYGDENKRGLGFGLGSTRDFGLDELPKGKNVYYIPCANNNHEVFKTEEGAAKEGREWLIELLRSQGCPAFLNLKN